MRRKNLLALSLATASLLLVGTAARADSILTISLAAPYQSGGGGDQLAFDATVTNNTDLTVYLNGDGPNIISPVTSPALSVDDSPYYSYPLSLNPYQSYTGLLFNIDIPDGALIGLYTGSFVITGEADAADVPNSGAADQLGAVSFDVAVTPEPSNWLLLGSGLAALALTKA